MNKKSPSAYISRAALAAAIALVFLGACGKAEHKAESKAENKAEKAGAETTAGKDAAKDAPKAAAADTVRIDEGQTKFLTIEAVGGAQSTEALSLPGRVTFRPQAQSAAGATVSGRVVAVLVQPGQVVRAGTPLLTIESADASAARAALDQANTRLASAEAFHKRQVEMVEKGVGLEFERQEAEARLAEARSEQARARHAAEIMGGGQGIRVSMRAPSDGVVMNIRAAVGAAVAPGAEALVELGDPNQLQVVAQVAESDLKRVTPGLAAMVDIPALNAKLSAKVENFNPRVDVDSRRLQVYFGLTQRAAGLRPGMLAQVTVQVDAEAGISVPATAVLIKGGTRRVVYVARSDGSFEARDVTVGRNENGRALLLQGLKPGEKVVTRGALLLDSQAEQLL